VFGCWDADVARAGVLRLASVLVVRWWCLQRDVGGVLYVITGRVLAKGDYLRGKTGR